MEIKMATTKSILANATKNNGGSAVQIGPSKILSNLGLGLDSPATGSVVIDGTDTNKSVDSAIFAKNTQRPLGQRLSESPSLVGGSSYPRYFRQINSIEAFDSPGTATAFRAGYFNLYTGKWSINPTVTYDNMHKAVNSIAHIDTEAHVTRSNPGSLTFLSGSKIPVNQNYESKRS